MTTKFAACCAICTVLFASHARSDAPAGRYAVCADTVYDTQAHLTWQRAVAPASYDQAGALAYCEALELGGYSDWRLPTIHELHSLVDIGRSNPAIDTTAFPNTPSEPFWTSTPSVSEPGYTWAVSFGSGYGSSRLDTSADTGVRCVR